MNRWLGIDFSGNRRKWSSSCRTSNVWVADIRGNEGEYHVHDLRRAREIVGELNPFDRLSTFLSQGDYLLAAIDAPFSVPKQHLPDTGHAGLFEIVQRANASPFPSAKDFVALLSGLSDTQPKKPLRFTERIWQNRGVNVRSALWVQPRGGAAMTAACLRLLGSCRRPLWPWDRTSHGLLVEAFPAAQLRQWGLPHQKYNGCEEGACAVRTTILNEISKRVQVDGFREVLCTSADALDAVLCAFAGIAVSTGKLSELPNEEFSEAEGWIAVHS